MYIKPTSHFTLSKTTKRLMATIRDDELRHAFKNCMIQAQLESMIKPKEKKGKEQDE